jgi:predicted RNA-binding Zn-ribbon protein involved in translation (DUF1610 family)
MELRSLSPVLCGLVGERRNVAESQIGGVLTTATWHCPKCGGELRDADGQLLCDAGAMRLSRKVDDHIRRIRPQGPTPPAPQEASLGRASPERSHEATWFCPWCGAPMRNGASQGACPSCGQLLEPWARYALIELHPHHNWPTRQLSPLLRLRAQWARLYAWLRWGF